MIRVLGEAFGRSPRVRELPMEPGDVERTFADLERARALLDYRPSTDFPEGIRRFAEWYLAEGAQQDEVLGTA
jgi:UDP-glucuronate 4-epimerase